MDLLFLQYRLPGKQDFITIEANEYFQYRFGPNSRGRKKKSSINEEATWFADIAEWFHALTGKEKQCVITWKIVSCSQTWIHKSEEANKRLGGYS